VLQVDGSVRNAGITRLSVRPQPADPGVLAIQVQVLNGGDTREARTVELRAGARPLGVRTIEIDAGAATTLDFAVPATGSRIGAHLMPGDALPDDDSLEVDPAALAPVSAAVDPNCPDSVGRAVRVHPGLHVADGDPAQLLFDCGGVSAADGSAPRVRLARGAPKGIDGAELLWSPAADALRRRIEGRLPTSARGALEPPRAADVVLLAAGASPLIVMRGGAPRVVDCALDFDAAVVVAGPGSPLLLAGLAEIALDAPLLGRIASAGRGNDASRVVPLATVAVERPTVTAVGATRINLLPLLLLVLALLAFDVVTQARRITRDLAASRSSRA
jgi:hypothetical protein